MGYQIYKIGQRWGGYGVPAVCEYPTCNEEIDRGMSYACGGVPFSDYGCDRYFCERHTGIVQFKSDGSRCRHKKDCDCEYIQLCERCARGKPPFHYKPETKEWTDHLLNDESWEEWRKKNPKEVTKLKATPII